MSERKAIPKSVRFEVFKRDSFTCQYCGAKAPDVILHVDHIKSVASGGENEIVNLITSCAGCNLGKGATALDDKSALEKQRKQLEELNERRNQLEMMVQWREGLIALEDDQVEYLRAEILQFSNFGPNDKGVNNLRSWLKRYDFDEVVKALRTAFSQYVGAYRDDEERWDKAFDAVPRIVEANRRGGMPQEKLRLFYVRGILRKRVSFVNERQVMKILTDAADSGVPVEVLVEVAKYARNWSGFTAEVYDLMDSYGNFGDDAK